MDDTFTFPRVKDGTGESKKIEDAMISLVAQGLPPGMHPQDDAQPTDEAKKSWIDGLRYRINAEIEVTMDTDWTIFSNFTLTEISLRAKFAMSRDYPAIIGVELDSLFVYDFDTKLQVTGTIPNITSTEDMDFDLTVKVYNALDVLPVYGLLERLAGAESSKSCLRVDDELRGSGQAARGIAVAAKLTITRTANVGDHGGDYFLKAVEFSLITAVDLPLIPDRLTLTSVRFAFMLKRKMPTDKFSTNVTLIGKLLAGQSTTLMVKGNVRMQKNIDIDLVITAQPMSGIRPQTLFGMIMGQEGSSSALSSSRFPPSVQYPEEDYFSYCAELSIRRTTEQGWSIQRLVLAIDLRDLDWKPVKQLELQLNQVSFLLCASKPTEKLPSDSYRDPTDSDIVAASGKREDPGKVVDGFRYVGTIQAILALANTPLSVAVTYDSLRNLVTIAGSVQDNVLVSMQDLLTDSKINDWVGNRNTNDVVKASKESKLPASCPVDLCMVGESGFCYRRRLTLVVSETKVTRVRLIAEYSKEQVNWALWADLTATQMGLLVDIDRSAEDVSKNTIIHLSAFGRFRFKNGLELFGAIDAAKSADVKHFWMRLSASIGYDAPLGSEPYKVLAASEFGELDLDVKTWKLPSSAPKEADADSILRSFQARLDIMVAQSTTKTGDKTVMKNSFAGAKLQVTVAGPWTIFEGFRIANFSAHLLAGSFGSDDATLKADEKKKKALKLEVSCALEISGMSLRLGVSFVKVTGETTTFLMTLKPTSTNATTQGLLALPELGSNQADDASKGVIPSEFPAKPQELLTSNGISGEMRVTKESSPNGNPEWTLAYVKFTLSKEDEWVIIDGKLRLTKASLTLQVDKPKTKDKSLHFSASASFMVGGTKATGNIEMTKQGEHTGQMLATLEGKSANQHIKTLTGTDASDLLSQSSIIDQTEEEDKLSLSLFLSKDGGYRLDALKASFETEEPWNLGPFAVQHLKLFILFSKDGKKSVYFEGLCMVAGKTATVTVVFLGDQSLQITFQGSNISCTDLVSHTGSEVTPDKQAQLPGEAGFDDYENKKLGSGLAASALFRKGGTGTWEAVSLTLSISSTEDKWSLVPNTLWLTEISLMLTLKKGQEKSWQLQASLVANFEYARPPPEASPGQKRLTMSVSRDEFVATLSTEGCTLPQFVYIITAGYLDLPDFVPSFFTPDTLKATVNWKKKLSNFDAIFPDWTLPSFMKKIACMKQPRLDLQVSGWGSGGTGAEGWLRGTAVVLGLDIPLGYKLPSGPFTVFGIDVKRIWDLVKKIYQFFRFAGQAMAAAAGAAAAVAADLAAFAIAAFEMAAAALGAFIAAVEAALIACGVAIKVVKAALKALGRLWDLLTDRDGHHSGGSSSDDDDDKSKESSNRNSSKLKESISVSGPGLSPGSPGEVVKLIIYPKGKGGRIWVGFDPAGVRLSTSVSGLTVESTASNWSPCANDGFKTIYTRPDATYQLYLHYQDIDLSWVIPVEPGFASQLSLANTILRSPSTGLIQQPMMAEIWPRDQLNMPRYGQDKADVFAVTLVDFEKKSVPVKMLSRNDCVLIKYTMQEPGAHLLSVTVGGMPVQSQPLIVTALLGVDSGSTFACGEGVSSGMQKVGTSFEIRVRDARNKEYTPTAEEQTHFAIQLSAAGTGSVTQQLAVQFTQGRGVVSYTRPEKGMESYSIDITFRGAPINGSPYVTMSLDEPAKLDLENSLFEVEEGSMPVRVRKQVHGLLRLRDNTGYDWKLPDGDCKATWVSGPSLNATVSSNGDGTYTVTWTPPAAGLLKFIFESQTGNTQEMTLDIGEQPAVFNVLARNPSSSLIDLSLMDQYGGPFPWDASKVAVTAYARDKAVIPVEIVASGAKYSKIPDILGLGFNAPTGTIPAMTSPYRFSTKTASAKNSFLHQGPVFPPKVQHEPISTSRHRTNSIRSLLLVTRDEDGRRGDDDDDGLIVGLVDNMDGTYEIQVIPPSSGSSGLQITMSGQQTAGSPYTLLASEKVWSTVAFSGEGWERGIIQEDSSFEMTFLNSKGEVCEQGVQDVSVTVFSPDYSFTLDASVTLQPGRALVKYSLGSEVKPGLYFCRALVNTLAVSTAAHQIFVEESVSTADIHCSGVVPYSTPEEKLSLLECKTAPHWAGSFDVSLSNVVTKQPITPAIFSVQPQVVDEKGTLSAEVEFEFLKIEGDNFKVAYRPIEEGCVSIVIVILKNPNLTIPIRFWATDAAHSTVRQDPFYPEAKWPLMPLHNYGFTVDKKTSPRALECKKTLGTVAQVNRPMWLPGIEANFSTGLVVSVSLSIQPGGIFEGFELFPFIRPSCNIYPILMWNETDGFHWRQGFGHHRVRGSLIRKSSLSVQGTHSITVFWSANEQSQSEELSVFESGQLISTFHSEPPHDRDTRFWPQQGLVLNDVDIKDQFTLSFEDIYTMPTIYRDTGPTVKHGQVIFRQAGLKDIQSLFVFSESSGGEPRALIDRDFGPSGAAIAPIGSPRTLMLTKPMSDSPTVMAYDMVIGNVLDPTQTAVIRLWGAISLTLSSNASSWVWIAIGVSDTGPSVAQSFPRLTLVLVTGKSETTLFENGKYAMRFPVALQDRARFISADNVNVTVGSFKAIPWIQS